MIRLHVHNHSMHYVYCVVAAMKFMLLYYLSHFIFFMNKAFALKTCFGPPLKNSTSSPPCDKSNEYFLASVIVHSILPPLINKSKL